MKIVERFFSERAARVWTVGASIVAIITFPLVVAQVWDIRDQRASRELQRSADDRRAFKSSIVHQRSKRSGGCVWVADRAAICRDLPTRVR